MGLSHSILLAPLLLVSLGVPTRAAQKAPPAKPTQGERELSQQTLSPENLVKALFKATATSHSAGFLGLCDLQDLEREEIAYIDELYTGLQEVYFETKFLGKTKYNGSRALLNVHILSRDAEGEEEIETPWLWMHKENGMWRLRYVSRNERYSHEWLFESPKHGLARDPLSAAKAFFTATEAGDAIAAERACSDAGWIGTSEGLAALYEAARGLGLGFRAGEPRSAGDRGVVPFTMTALGQDQGSAQLLVQEIGDGWIVVSMDGDERHIEAFLAGQVEANCAPRLPSQAAEAYVVAINHRQPVRIRRLSTEGYLGEIGTARPLVRENLRRGQYQEVIEYGEVQDGRCYCRVRVAKSDARTTTINGYFLLLEETPAGWRVSGTTQNEPFAQAYVEGKIRLNERRPQAR